MLWAVANGGHLGEGRFRSQECHRRRTFRGMDILQGTCAACQMATYGALLNLLDIVLVCWLGHAEMPIMLCSRLTWAVGH